jgi:hypothetical protein
MIETVPDWIKARGGDLKPSRDGHSWTFYLAGQPQFLVEPVPANGKFACRVSLTNNGKRLEKGSVYETSLEAMRGGLDDLRDYLGW